MFRNISKSPSLESDCTEAKALLEGVRASDQKAFHRFIEHHPCGVPAHPRLADAKLVIAREYGFPSWSAWKSYVEMRGLDPQRRVEAVTRAVCSNDIARARVILAVEPELVREDFYLACACGEVEIVEAGLLGDPQLAVRPGGASGWDAIQYGCFSRWLRCDPRRAEGIVGVVRRLLEGGANPNAFHTIEWMGEPAKETVLFAASGIANNAELTRLLLAAGADVNEGLAEPDPRDPSVSPWGTEVLYHTAEFRDTTCLKMLLEAGPYPTCVSYCLGRALDFECPESVRLFLAHGADPNFAMPDGRSHLIRAVRSGRSLEIIAALLDAGADIEASDAGGLMAFRHAVRQGREDVQYLLESRGCRREATQEDRAIGRIVKGQPSDGPVQLPPELLCEAARRNDVAAINRLLDAGAAIDTPDPGPFGSPPLHWAAWRGRFAAAQALVARGADIHVVNPYGGDALGTAIHGSTNCFDLDGGPAMRLPEEAVAGEYAEIVELLITAGAKLPGEISDGSEPVQDVLWRHGIVYAEA